MCIHIKGRPSVHRNFSCYMQCKMSSLLTICLYLFPKGVLTTMKEEEKKIINQKSKRALFSLFFLSLFSFSFSFIVLIKNSDTCVKYVPAFGLPIRSRSDLGRIGEIFRKKPAPEDVAFCLQLSSFSYVANVRSQTYGKDLHN